MLRSSASLVTVGLELGVAEDGVVEAWLLLGLEDALPAAESNEVSSPTPLFSPLHEIVMMSMGMVVVFSFKVTGLRVTCGRARSSTKK